MLIFCLTNQIALVIVYSTLDESGPERATRPRDGGEEREVEMKANEPKKSWKARATALAKRVNALDERNDAVLRNQEIRELKGLLAYYPPPRSAREFRGDWVTVLYRLPSGGKTANIWTAVEKWRAL